MRRSKNRIFAWLVLGTCVFAGTFGLGGLHLQRSRAAVLEVFYGGAETAHPGESGMHALLNRAGQCAQIMAAEARRYLGDDHAGASIMSANASLLVQADGLNERCGAYLRIRSEADSLMNAMYALRILDGERVNFKRAYDDFWRCDSFIRREPYREMAAAYNRSIEGFPAGLVAQASGAEKLNCFDV